MGEAMENDGSQDQQAAPAAEQSDAELWAELEAADAGSPPEGRDEGDQRHDEASSDPDTAPANPAGAETQNDPWANAPPELRSALEAERQARLRAEHQARSDQGRMAAYQRELERLRTGGGDQPQRQRASIADDPKVKQVAEEYGEVVAPLIEAFDRRIADLDTDLSSLVQERRQGVIAAEEGRLLEQHPDYKQVVAGNRDQFLEWLADQPRPIRESFERNRANITDAREAALVVGLFKQHLGVSNAPTPEPPLHGGTSSNPLAGRRERQLEASRVAKTRPTMPVTTGVPDTDDPKAAWDYWEREDQRRARNDRRA